MEQKVTVINKVGEKLAGLYSKGIKGAIVLVHGFGADKTECGLFDQLADFLIKEGYSTYRFDFSGRGESEGDYADTSPSKLRDDLEKIIEFVKEDRIGILTQSLGGPVAIALNPKVSCIAMMGSPVDSKPVLEAFFKEDFNPKGISTRQNSGGEKIKVGPQFWKDLDNCNLEESIKKIGCPLLFIHGTKDETVPVEQAFKLSEAANRPKSLILVGEGKHNPVDNPKHMLELQLRLSEWFGKWM